MQIDLIQFNYLDEVLHLSSPGEVSPAGVGPEEWAQMSKIIFETQAIHV